MGSELSLSCIGIHPNKSRLSPCSYFFYFTLTQSYFNLKKLNPIDSISLIPGTTSCLCLEFRDLQRINNGTTSFKEYGIRDRKSRFFRISIQNASIVENENRYRYGTEGFSK
jgi:hypothetical protein